MKKLWIMLLVLALLLSGCGGAAEDTDPAFELTADLLDALLDSEYSRACQYVDGSLHADLRANFEGLTGTLAGVEDYTLHFLSYQSNVTNGMSSSQTQYRMDTDQGDFVVVAILAEGYSGLAGFHVAPFEETTLYYTGTLDHMAGADWVQWLMIGLSAVTAAGVIWMVVDCLRRKMRYKWLCAAFILLFSMLVTLSFSSGGVNFRFNAGLNLVYSALIRYGDGSQQLQLWFPLGAIIYRCLRSRLTQPPEPPEETEEE